MNSLLGECKFRMDIANNRKLKTINQNRKQSLPLLLPVSYFLFPVS
jgi:hypothetical protein